MKYCVGGKATDTSVQYAELHYTDQGCVQYLFPSGLGWVILISPPQDIGEMAALYSQQWTLQNVQPCPVLTV